MSSNIICAFCGSFIEEDNRYTVGEEFVCSGCATDETSLCECCGDRFWNDDNYGDSNIFLCEHCRDYYYTTCYECGRIIHTDDVFNIDDSDDNFCCYCYHRYMKNVMIREYSYKPEPIFYGEDNRYFGVELEIDYGGRSNDNAGIISKIANQEKEHIYIKHDGSLEDGMEIVTHPMTLDYHMNEMNWTEILEKAIDLGYKSHKTSTCGLHIHVNRSSFGSSLKLRDTYISHILFIVERFWEELLCFSRRTESQVNRWAARYGYRNVPMEILDTAKKKYIGRYACVNIMNDETIEFRIFKGTLKYNTIIATLQLVNEICNVAVSMSEEELTGLSWCQFVKNISEYNHELITYLKERRFYINESVVYEEER